MLGSDFVGGSMANWLGQKDMIGVIARELLMGEPRRESLRMHPPVASVCSVDWTQLQHWQLPANRLPAGCQVLFRPPPFWEQYKRETAAIAIVLLIQSALIIALILQRHRRHVAELELQNQRAQLAHASRLATVGELSASIAHEINQPLSAILSNAEAGSRLIAAGKAQLTELHEIFDAIRDDDMRASEVILRMRRLLRLEPNDAQPLDVNEAVESILRLTAGAARKNGVVVRCDLDRTIPPVKGDYVQIQQVLLNLVLNAMEAMADTPPERRQVSISTGARPPGQVEICVADRGPGIEPDKLSKVFEPFFTSKANGMGLGLSITRSIVHAHHGKIRVESNAEGATFTVSFPT
jgi:C4-dicarboxylate-specific signal transduction histidine kinase